MFQETRWYNPCMARVSLNNRRERSFGEEAQILYYETSAW